LLGFFFASLVAAGLGVRKGSTAAMLRLLMPVDAAIVAVLLRGLVQFAEVACLGACFVPAALPAGRIST
jgi:hypothetical protein